MQETCTKPENNIIFITISIFLCHSSYIIYGYMHGFIIKANVISYYY